MRCSCNDILLHRPLEVFYPSSIRRNVAQLTLRCCVASHSPVAYNKGSKGNAQNAHSMLYYNIKKINFRRPWQRIWDPSPGGLALTQSNFFF